MAMMQSLFCAVNAVLRAYAVSCRMLWLCPRPPILRTRLATSTSRLVCGTFLATCASSGMHANHELFAFFTMDAMRRAHRLRLSPSLLHSRIS
jgi:hypothetical protein